MENLTENVQAAFEVFHTETNWQSTIKVPGPEGENLLWIWENV